MKLAVVVLVAGLCAIASTNVVKEQKVADKNYQKIQKDVLLILQNINQPSYYKEYVDIGNTYSVSENKQKYTNQSAVEQFLQQYQYGFLPRGQIFSVFYYNQLKQAIALFRLFYYAQDYQTFYNTAVWARQNLNEGLFLYAYSVAVAHRPDTMQIVLPPIYEVYPYYFVNADAIQQAYKYKQQYGGENVQEGGYNGYTINYNYSGYYLNLHPEQGLSYYLEDVGINSFYYYYNIYYPFWMSSKEFGFQYVNRGEEYYYLYQQLLARYYLERLSNGYGDTPYFDLNAPFETPYYPSLQYPNGLPFPSRPAYANLNEYYYNYGQKWTTSGVYGYSPALIEDYERRITDAIDSGYIYSKGQQIDLYSKEGFNVLGNIIQANQDSPNYVYYGAVWYFASHLLGYSYQPLNDYQIAPSALEHFETALRDPAFYQLYKRIVLRFQRYYSNVKPYSYDDLVFPGVKITQFNVDKLVTYEDDYYIDVSNAVYYSQKELQQQQQQQSGQGNFNVRVKQTRLNNKPFTYKINVQSEKATKAVVKIYLGPVYDEYERNINLTQNRLNFVGLDYFVYDLQSGENVISRNSYDSMYFAQDPVSYDDLLRQYSGQQQPVQGEQNYYSFPQRYMLPKGSKGGYPYQFYVIVYPYVPKEGQQQESQGSGSQGYQSFFYPTVEGKQFYDSYSLGYPFDRFIEYEEMFYQIPNIYSYQTNIYHYKNVNAVQSD
ncbi:hypothetical protein NQ318_004863 [Aromia moschata]|uniref:Hexamerin n=1 Tax=Aromia moschata TaxID=1265417 RepID=A0AAV8YZC4_9CUCU|nr:hypothetical protein NQ318_004863 [Aromia moschata]